MLEKFGQPTAIIGKTMIFEHEHQEAIRGEAYTAANTVYVAFDGGVTTSIQVWKDTTN